MKTLWLLIALCLSGVAALTMVEAQQCSGPLTRAIIERLLALRSPDKTTALEVRTCGLAFTPTAEWVESLRQRGAGALTIQAVSALLPKPTPTPRPTPTPTPTPPPFVIAPPVVQIRPDDEPPPPTPRPREAPAITGMARVSGQPIALTRFGFDTASVDENGRVTLLPGGGAANAITRASAPAAPGFARVGGSSVPLVGFSFTTAKTDESGKVIQLPGQTKWQFVEDLGGGVRLEMVEVAGGTFSMGTAPTNVTNERRECERHGSSKADCERWINWETPQHDVRVPDFYLGKFEVTQAQWRAVAKLPKVNIDLKPDPSNFKGDDLPVESISWDEAQEFCARLARKTGRDYRLSSEAQWEYAARAGTTTPFAFGPTITPDIVNYDGNYPYGKAPKGLYREKTVPVGSLKVANAFGLFDMHGNVWEWCEDVWHDSYRNAPTDGSAYLSGGDSSNLRVLRGGSWINYGRFCRAALRVIPERVFRNYLYGFRVVCLAARTS